MDGKRRADIRPGQQVEIVLKKDQPTGRRTRGVVRRILTHSPTHPHGPTNCHPHPHTTTTPHS